MNEHRFIFSKRFLVGILAFFGETTIFSLRSNINIAILGMTSNQTITYGNTTVIQEPEFKWDSQTKGFVIGAYAYGNIFTILGGYFPMRFGGATVITISSLISSILTLLSPFVVRLSFYLFITLRIFEGACEHVKFVSFHELWTQWSPARDRSKLMAITLNGMYFGPAITYPLCGFITHKYGWPAAFYVTGGLTLIWMTIWFILVPNSPATDKWISKRELAYIQQDPPKSRPKNMTSIWKNMLISKHVHAIGAAKIGYNFGMTVVVTCLPMYIEDLTHSRIDEIGIYSAIPTAINLFTIPCVGIMLDYLQNKNYFTVTQTHKLFACCAFLVGGITLFAMAYLSYNMILLMVYLTLFKLTISVNYVVCNINAVTLAPRCSSVLASFLSLYHMLGAVTSSMIIAFIVTDHSLSQWSTCFVTFGATSFIAATIFFIFGSSVPQPWAYSIDEVDAKSDDPNRTTLLPQPDAPHISFNQLVE